MIKRALMLAERALELRDDESNTLLLFFQGTLGLTQMHEGNYEEAEEALRRALSSEDGKLRALAGSGVALCASHQGKLADTRNHVAQAERELGALAFARRFERSLTECHHDELSAWLLIREARERITGNVPPDHGPGTPQGPSAMQRSQQGFLSLPTEVGYASDMSEVTRILESLGTGASESTDDLLPLVYGELRQLAAAKMASERAGHTLQATALVHEVWIKLVGAEGGSLEWKGRKHFYAAAAEAMRRILIDHARRKLASRRGGEWLEITFGDFAAPRNVRADEMIDLNDALDPLTEEDREKVEVAKLRLFRGVDGPRDRPGPRRVRIDDQAALDLRESMAEPRAEGRENKNEQPECQHWGSNIWTRSRR